MSKKLIRTISLVFTLAAASAAYTAAPAGAVAGASPGACNMLNVFNSPSGFDGMLQSGSGTGQGLANMIALVVASENLADRPGSVSCP
jgi:hypothetical protein